MHNHHKQENNQALSRDYKRSRALLLLVIIITILTCKCICNPIPIHTPPIRSLDSTSVYKLTVNTELDRLEILNINLGRVTSPYKPFKISSPSYKEDLLKQAMNMLVVNILIRIENASIIMKDCIETILTLQKPEELIILLDTTKEVLCKLKDTVEEFLPTIRNLPSTMIFNDDSCLDTFVKCLTGLDPHNEVLQSVETSLKTLHHVDDICNTRITTTLSNQDHSINQLARDLKTVNPKEIITRIIYEQLNKDFDAIEVAVNAIEFFGYEKIYIVKREVEAAKDIYIKYCKSLFKRLEIPLSFTETGFVENRAEDLTLTLSDIYGRNNYGKGCSNDNQDKLIPGRASSQSECYGQSSSSLMNNVASSKSGRVDKFSFWNLSE